MNHYAHKSHAELEEIEAGFLREFKDAAPSTYAEWEQVKEAMKKAAPKPSAETPPGAYRKFRTPLHAIIQCLQQHGGWMKKPHIVRELERGGFPGIDENTGHQIIGNAVKNNGKAGGKLARILDGDWVGLPEWVGNETIRKIR